MRTRLIAALSVLLFAFGLAACDDTLEGVRDDAEDIQEGAGDAADDIGDGVESLEEGD